MTAQRNTEAERRRLVPRTEMRPPMTMDTATERTGPIGTLILITDDEMRDILTHIAGAGDRVLFDRLRDRWMSLRYGTRSGPEVPARGRVVDAWDEGYRAGVHDATHPASSPTINPYQRSDVDADHVIAEAARAWWRADQRVTAEIEALDSVKAAHQRLTETLASEAAWLSRQPGQGAGRASPQSHAPHRPALTEEDR